MCCQIIVQVQRVVFENMSWDLKSLGREEEERKKTISTLRVTWDFHLSDFVSIAEQTSEV